MKIALIGYGKMGHEVQQILLNRGHEIVFITDDFVKDSDHSDFLTADVAIEFTVPEAAISNIHRAAEKGIPIVCGTTGWLSNIDEVSDFINQKDATLFYASNYSVGMYLFRQLNIKLAQLMQPYSQYSPSMQEVHHIHKKDAPSGTAITLAEELIQQNPALSGWSLIPIESKEILPIEAIREGQVVGKHSITYSSDFDTIEIVHDAHNRKGFALGAVLAAEFIADKKGVFTMNNLFNLK